MNIFKRKSRASNRQKGFSLIDLLVGMAISMLALLAIERAISLGLNGRRIVSESLDAEISANMAIAQLESEIKSSGYGISSPPFLMCTLYYFDPNSNSTKSLTLNPIEINAGAGANGSDDITISKVNGLTGFASSPLNADHPASPDVTDFNLTIPFNFFSGEQVILTDGATNCMRLALTADPVGTAVAWAGGSTGNQINPPSGTPFAATTAGSMMNAGKGISIRKFHVDSTTKSLTKTEVLGNNVAMGAADQIVQVRAFYGKATSTGMQVASWDQTTPTTSADWSKVLAIRLAVVAKSKAREGSAITPGPIKLWPDETMAGSTTPIAGPNLTLAAEDQHYRYVTRSMIIPLRNMIWNNN